MTTSEPSRRPDDPTRPPQQRSARRPAGRHLRSVTSGGSGSDRAPRRVRVREEADLLALIPYTFGFHPHESLVMMLLGSRGEPMFARVDMPTDAHEADLACAELLQAAVVNQGRRAVLVAYTDDEAAAFLAVEQAADELTLAGFEVMVAIRADGHRWWRLLPVPDLGGVAYDIGSHPITAAGVLEGRVTLGSRRQLEESLLPADPDELEAVAAACAELATLPSDLVSRREEARWLQAWVGRRVSSRPDDGGDPADVTTAEVARVVRALSDVELRDVAWASMDRGNADAHVWLWTAVVVRCPLDRLAPAAGLLAFAAWLSGHGALAWCAVDRSLQSDPDHRLAHLVAQTLDGAMPPATWEGVDPTSLTILSG